MKKSIRFVTGILVPTFLLAGVAATPAIAQLLQRKDISASMALNIAEAAIAACRTNGYAVSVTVVGRNGEIIVQVRGDNTGPHTMENSMRKAYTARTFRAPSGALETRWKSDPALSLIHLANVIAAQGGLLNSAHARLGHFSDFAFFDSNDVQSQHFRATHIIKPAGVGVIRTSSARAFPTA